jgi:porphobilinogen synthase
MSSQFPEARPRRLRRNASLRSLFQETEFSLNDLVLPIFVEEEIDDFVPIKSMPGVMRIPESKLAGEIERYARAGIKSVMTFGVSHHLDASGSDTWRTTAWCRACRDRQGRRAGNDRDVRHLLSANTPITATAV